CKGSHVLPADPIRPGSGKHAANRADCDEAERPRPGEHRGLIARNPAAREVRLEQQETERPHRIQLPHVTEITTDRESCGSVRQHGTNEPQREATLRESEGTIAVPDCDEGGRD